MYMYTVQVRGNLEQNHQPGKVTISLLLLLVTLG